MTPDLRVYAVLDPERCRGRDPVALAAAAAHGGATLMQLRAKLLGTAELVELARRVVAALAPTNVPLIVNDWIDVALAAGASGAHVGQTDMAPADARRLLGPGAVLGVTLHHAHEADAIAPGLASYAGIGPVFETASKDPGDPPIGPDGLGRLVRHLRQRLDGLPVCGIAGVDHGNAAAVIAAGADGVAVISGLFMAEDVEAAARRLRAVVDTALATRGAA